VRICSTPAALRVVAATPPKRTTMRTISRIRNISHPRVSTHISQSCCTIGILLQSGQFFSTLATRHVTPLMMNRLPPLRALCTRSDHRKLHPRQIEPCDLMAPVRRQGAVPGPPRWGSSYRSGTGCSRCRLAASLRRSYPPWADRPQPSATSLAIMNGHSGQPRINILPGSCCNLRATAYRDPVAAVVEDLDSSTVACVFIRFATIAGEGFRSCARRARQR
jgi:hypothetical protein